MVLRFPELRTFIKKQENNKIADSRYPQAVFAGGETVFFFFSERIDLSLTYRPTQMNEGYSLTTSRP